MKKWLVSQNSDEDYELQNAVKDWLHAQVAEFYEEEICKLVKHYDKCLNLNGDHIEI